MTPNANTVDPATVSCCSDPKVRGGRCDNCEQWLTDQVRDNRRVSVAPDGSVGPVRARVRKLPAGTFVIVRFGRTNFHPDGKGDRIARVVMHDLAKDEITVSEWIASANRWRANWSVFGVSGIMRIATEGDIKKYHPGKKVGGRR